MQGTTLFSSYRKLLISVIGMILGTSFCFLPSLVGAGHPSLSPTAASATVAPHAPPITNPFGTPLFEEQVTELQIQPGATVPFIVRDYWKAPAGVVPSCASGVIVFTWMVREPYPKGGDALELRRVIPQAGGKTEAFAQGSTGSASGGYCDEISLINHSAQEYTVEIRYAFGNHP